MKFIFAFAMVVFAVAVTNGNPGEKVDQKTLLFQRYYLFLIIIIK